MRNPFLSIHEYVDDNNVRITTYSEVRLRDLAAIAAMQGLLTNSLPGTNCGVLAIDAVNYADALLAELEK